MCAALHLTPTLTSDGLQSDEDQERATKPTSEEEIEQRPASGENWCLGEKDVGHHVAEYCKAFANGALMVIRTISSRCARERAHARPRWGISARAHARSAQLCGAIHILANLHEPRLDVEQTDIRAEAR